MKLLGLVLLVGGWAVAVGSALITDATAGRMVITLLGFGATIAGVLTLNAGHLEHAIWKRKGGLTG